MGTIAIKLVDLTRRVADLEAQIALQGQQAAFLEEHGRLLTAADQAVAAMQKRLSSLKRSCQILARHPKALLNSTVTPASSPAGVFFTVGR